MAQQNQDLNIVTPSTPVKDPSTDISAVRVELTLRAPASRVFAALSKPELLKQWRGPEGFSCLVVHLDFRVGGKYLVCMQKDDDPSVEIWSTGRCLEIEQDRKIVSADSPANSRGEIVTNRAGLNGPFADVGETTITFELAHAEDNLTELTLIHAGLPTRMHDECTEGWASALGKLKKLVERH